MSNKEKAEIKDLLLKEFKNLETASKVSDKNKIDFSIVCSLSEELVDEGYLCDFAKIAHSEPSYRGNFVARTSQKGFFFLNQEGGSVGANNAQSKTKRFNVAKMVATIGNAILILSISAWAVLETRKSNSSNNELIEINDTLIFQSKQIDSLKNELDSLRNSKQK